MSEILESYLVAYRYWEVIFVGKTYRFRFWHGIAFLLCIWFLVLLFSHPQESIAGAVSGLLLCGQVVIPSLFPFAVVALFLSKCGILRFFGRFCEPVSKVLFYVNGEVFMALFMSFIGGYPVGARLIRELYDQKKLSRPQAQEMLCYSVNAGPAFVVVAVGAGILHNRQIGALLLAAHILSSLLLAVISGLRMRKKLGFSPMEERKAPLQSISDAFVSATADAAASIFGICAWVVLFATIQALLAASGLPEVVISISSCLLEVTTAVLGAGRNYILIAAILGWSGICVHCQVLSVCAEIRPNYLKFLFYRLLHGGLSAGIFFLLLKLFPQSVETLSNQVGAVFGDSSVSLAASLALLFLCLVLLFYVSDRRPQRFL